METPTQNSVSVRSGQVLRTWSIQDGVLVEERYVLGQGPMSHGARDLLRGPEVDSVFKSIKKAALGEI